MRKLGIIVLTLAVGCGGAETTVETVASQLTVEEQREGWELLFDGETMEGWSLRGEARWVVEDGALTAVVGSGRGFLVTNDDFEDFRLRVEFWVDDVANGGVFFRVPESGDITQSNSFEVNIYDAHELWPTGSINEIARYDNQSTEFRWNTLDISAQGDRLIVYLNDELAVDARAERLQSGPIAIQYVGEGLIRYRSIRVLAM